MQTEKLSYPGIAGAVAGVVALIGVFSSWYQIDGPGGSLRDRRHRQLEREARVRDVDRALRVLGRVRAPR